MKRRAFAVVALFAALCGVGLVAASLICRQGKTLDLFKQYVLNPIPESVARIRADQPKTLGGYGYTFRFAIDRSDLTLILGSRPLEQVHGLGYDDKVLYWRWGPTSSVSMSPYGQSWWPREPKWFANLAVWKNVEAYALEQERDGGEITEVLIYNPRLEEVIFLAFYAR